MAPNPLPTIVRHALAYLLLTGSVWAQELPVLVRSFAETKDPSPPFENGVFQPHADETIAFLGGTNTLEQLRYPFFETRLAQAFPGLKLHLRNLAWQGDTIYYQDRPRYFYTVAGDAQPGSSPDTRERTQPGIIFLEFGKMESLERDVAGFKAAYQALLDELMKRTRRLVLVAPAPFFPTGPAGAQVDSRNQELGKFAQAIKELAVQNQLLFVDGFTPLRDRLDPSYSVNGVHLTETGHRALAEIWATQLKLPAVKPAPPALLSAIEAKNRSWRRYYYPTNWAFLFGDRQHVPASRDHVDTQKRWFLEELNSLPVLMKKAEEEINRYATEVAP